MAAPQKKDFLDTNDFTKEELLDMIELSRAMKGMIKAGALSLIHIFAIGLEALFKNSAKPLDPDATS